MALLANTFEGGTDGVTLTIGNSGGASGDPWGSLVIDPTCTCQFTSTAPAHGTMALLTAAGATSGQSYVAWTTGLSGNSVFSRTYHRFPANPAANVNFLRILNASNGILATVRVNTNGTITGLYNSSTFLGTSTATITANQYFRCEVNVVGGATGSMIVRLYLGVDPDSATITETLSAVSVNVGTGPPARLRVGVTTPQANVTGFRNDDIAFSDVDWIGPSASSGVTGTINGTLPALTGSLDGTVKVNAALAGTLPALTGSFAAENTVTGSISGTLPALTGTASGLVTVTGTLDGTLPALTGEMTGTVEVDGTVTGTLPALQGSFTGDVAGVVTGTLAGILPALTGGLDATVTARGTIEGNLPALTGSFTGAVPAVGTINGTLPALTGHFTGTSAFAPPADITITAGQPRRAWTASTPARAWTAGPPTT